jgi:hypothetical protein
MCGRATVINPDGITEKLYGYTKKFVPSDWKPRYNLNPHEDIPAVYFDPFLKNGSSGRCTGISSRRS